MFAYSDVPYEYVMHRSALVNALGADFRLLGPDHTMVKSTKPVIAVCAVRTGAGKSQTTRKIQTMLREAGKKVVSIRHPMPYGDLAKQAVQRYATIDDLKKHDCTIEEMEEYEPHVAAGNVIYAGVDYEAILREAEKEADVILWDGGNNDFSFYKADLYVTVADPHRPGDGLVYYPGEVNLRLADVVVLNKIDTADRAGIEAELAAVRSVNPTVRIIMGASPVTVDDPSAVQGKRVLVVEDGPTLTHGEMKYGAGTVAARQLGAAEFIDPRPFAVGEIKATFEKYPSVGVLLPGDGLLRRAARGPGDDDQRLRRGPRRHRHADRPAPHHRHQAAGRAREVRPAGDRSARRSPTSSASAASFDERRRARAHLIASRFATGAAPPRGGPPPSPLLPAPGAATGRLTPPLHGARPANRLREEVACHPSPSRPACPSSTSRDAVS